MSGVLLKKKKKIDTKRHFEPRVWRSVWGSRKARVRQKKIFLGPTGNGGDLGKKKNSSSPHKKYKMFRENVRPYSTVKKLGGSIPITALIGFKCTKACKLNFSTMQGIKKKTEVLKKNWAVTFRKYPSLLLTRKSTGHRMGKGKGKFSARVAIYKKNEIILEVEYLDTGVFGNHFNALLKTFPVPVKICHKSPVVFDTLKKLAEFEIARFSRVRKKNRPF